LQTAAAQIRAAGGKVSNVWADVTKPESVQALIDGAVAEFDRIDYLFNNAGIAGAGEIRDLTLDHWRRTLEVNLFGVIHGVHFALPVMIRQGCGHIVNTASAAGLAASPLMAPYAASKFAVVGISEALAAEARDFGVSVTAVCPGFIETPILYQPAVNADSRRVMANLSVKFIPVQAAVETILDGVARGKSLVVFPFYIHAVLFLRRFAPFAYRWIGRRTIREFRKIRRAPN
jgi:NAD(P)-dependent dehydrogenase (short-subunit alcohol dehydrogenase family)